MFLSHIGVGYPESDPGSGRYPLGSGEDSYQHKNGYISFRNAYTEYLKKGLSKNEIAKEMGLPMDRLNATITAMKSAEKYERYTRYIQLKEHGYSNTEIAKRLGVEEGTVRYMEKNPDKYNKDRVVETAKRLKEKIDEGLYVDVGKATYLQMGVSESTMKAATEMLRLEGYTYEGKVSINTGNKDYRVNISVLAPPDTDRKTINQNIDKIAQPADFNYSTDGGITTSTVQYPKSLDSSRIKVVYAEDGGTLKDGTIELRPGVPDLSMGSSSYAQVRILVDDKYYAKGMAFYNPDMEEGYDVIINSNKSRDKGLAGALKPIKDQDPENPFGATIKPVDGQTWYVDENGEKQLSVVNKLKSEGDWEKQQKTVASQMLAKQSKNLIKQQLKLTLDEYNNQFDDIMNIEQPEIKKYLLNEFAQKCDGGCVNLKATAFPGQQSKVILPVISLKDNEVYAPTYENGTELVLIRYPHGGTFEIPKLVVNNNNAEGKKTVTAISPDAIGINLKTAQKLSGADFDGDSVTVIPTSKYVDIKVKDTLKSMEDFDPHTEYAKREGSKIMKKSQLQNQMGTISNLIMDMTLQGARDDELARAVKHSMVVIDAVKHELDYTLSEKQNGIRELKDTYQDGGASTLITRAKSKATMPEFKKGQFGVDPETGEKVYKYTNRYYDVGEYVTDDAGNREWVVTKPHVKAMTNTNKMTKALAEKGTARGLSRGTQAEELYADYVDSLYALGNKARLEAYGIKARTVNQTAKEIYANEVKSLSAKLENANSNKPKERLALAHTESKVRDYMKTNFGTTREKDLTSEDKEDVRRYRQQQLAKYRVKYGSRKADVEIHMTSKEIDAIMAGALTSTMVNNILKSTNKDEFVKAVMPKPAAVKPTLAKINLMKSMAHSGYTLKEISERTGVSPSTVSQYIKGGDA